MAWFSTQERFQKIHMVRLERERSYPFNFTTIDQLILSMMNHGRYMLKSIYDELHLLKPPGIRLSEDTDKISCIRVSNPIYFSK